MPEDKKSFKVPSTFERGSQVPTQKEAPKMPSVKQPAPNTNSKENK